MSEDDLRQAVSAFADGEQAQSLGDEQIVDALVASPELREQWRRYHLIGDAMRGAAAQATVRRESPASRPAPRRVLPPDVRRDAVTRSSWRSPRNLAMAASLSAVAVVGAWWSSAPPKPDITVATRPIQRLERPANPHYGLTFKDFNWNVRGPEVEARLNNYLVSHNAYLAGGMQGMLPYARVVAYDAGR